MLEEIAERFLLPKGLRILKNLKAFEKNCIYIWKFLE